MTKYIFYAYTNLIGFTHAIRSRKDIIDLILNIMNIENLSAIKGKEDVTIIFCVSKMSRIFIYKNIDNIHSFQLPFILKYNNKKLEACYPKHIFHVNSLSLSILKSFFNRINITNASLDDIVEIFFNTMDDHDYNINKSDYQHYWGIIMLLLTFEPGYLRYDYDIQRESINHPEYHIDFNYSQNTTFKLGLHKKLSCQEFINLVDIKNNGIFFIE